MISYRFLLPVVTFGLDILWLDCGWTVVTHGIKVAHLDKCNCAIAEDTGENIMEKLLGAFFGLQVLKALLDGESDTSTVSNRISIGGVGINPLQSNVKPRF